jgi:hypothetical protein
MTMIEDTAKPHIDVAKVALLDKGARTRSP